MSRHLDKGPCAIPGCTWEETSKASPERKRRRHNSPYGWVCHGHYGRHRKGLDMTAPFRKYQPIPDGSTCDTEGCDLPVKREGYKAGRHFEGYGYACSHHTSRMETDKVWGGDVRPTKRQESYTLKRVRASLKMHGAKLESIPVGELTFRTRLDVRCLECGERGRKSIVKVCNTADAIKASTTPQRPNGTILGEGICAPCGKRKSTEALWGEEGFFGSWESRAADAIAEAASYGWDYIDDPYPGLEKRWTLRHRGCGRPYGTTLYKMRTCAETKTPVRPDYPHAGQGCPHCSPNGYDPALAGTLYLVRRAGAVMVGITNTTDTQPGYGRINLHRANGWVLVRTWDHSDGQVIWDCEKEVLRHWREDLNAPLVKPGRESASTRKVGLQRTIDYIEGLREKV